MVKTYIFEIRENGRVVERHEFETLERLIGFLQTFMMVRGPFWTTLSIEESLEKIRQKNPILAEAAGQIINYVKQLGDDIDIIGRKQFISFKVKVNGRTRRFLVLDYTRKSRLLIYDGKYEELLGEIRGNTVPHELLDRIKKEYLKMKKRG